MPAAGCREHLLDFRLCAGACRRCRRRCFRCTPENEWSASANGPHRKCRSCESMIMSRGSISPCFKSGAKRQNGRGRIAAGICHEPGPANWLAKQLRQPIDGHAQPRRDRHASGRTIPGRHLGAVQPVVGAQMDHAQTNVEQLGNQRRRDAMRQAAKGARRLGKQFPPGTDRPSADRSDRPDCGCTEATCGLSSLRLVRP